MKTKNTKKVKEKKTMKIIKKDSKYWLKKCKFKTIDQAENFNYHSIVALDYAERHLNHVDTEVKYLSAALIEIASDLCNNDYGNGDFLSGEPRQQLIKLRDQCSNKIYQAINREKQA